jgi:hypothetical protein
VEWTAGTAWEDPVGNNNEWLCDLVCHKFDREAEWMKLHLGRSRSRGLGCWRKTHVLEWSNILVQWNAGTAWEDPVSNNNEWLCDLVCHKFDREAEWMKLHLGRSRSRGLGCWRKTHVRGCKGGHHGHGNLDPEKGNCGW